MATQTIASASSTVPGPVVGIISVSTFPITLHSISEAHALVYTVEPGNVPTSLISSTATGVTAYGTPGIVSIPPNIQVNFEINWISSNVSVASSVLSANVESAGYNIVLTDPASQSTSQSVPPNSQSGSITSATDKSSTASSTTSALSKETTGTQNKSSGNKVLSGGAAAGIAIGCLVAGALIAGLLFLFFGRKSKSRNKGDREAGAVAFLPREKRTDVNVQSVGSTSPVSGIVDANLPQPLEDNAISGEINKIGNLIKNHVQSYYHSNRVSSAAADLEAFQTLGDNLPISPGTLGTLLANPNTREVALRLYIARVVLSRSEFDSDPSISFLPPEIAACIRSMSSFNNSTQVRSAFLSKWRSVTAELLQGTYSRNPFSTADSRNPNISRALEELDSILQLYTDSRNDNAQRRRNLEEILKRVATFAFTLFSQPSSWSLDWQDEKGTEPGSLVIFPALVQLSDETGQPLRHPRPLSEPIIRRVNG